MKSPDNEYSDGLEAELEALRKENAALLVAIEAKDVALNFANNEIFATPNRYLEAARYFQIRQALCDGIKTTPSPELLEARDRKRDAKLLRDVGAIFHCRAMIGTKNGVPIPEYQYAACLYAEVELPELAADRESGEWIPKLGD